MTRSASEEFRIEACKISRLEKVVPPVLWGHTEYAKTVRIITTALNALSENPGAVIGHSAKRIRSMLSALLNHLANGNGCLECGVSESDNSSELQLIEACTRYRASKHAQCASSLFKVFIDLPITDGSSGEEKTLVLLPSIERLLRDKKAVPIAPETPAKKKKAKSAKPTKPDVVN